MYSSNHKFSTTINSWDIIDRIRIIQSVLKLNCDEGDGTIEVNFHISIIFPEFHNFHRAVTTLDVPTDAPAAEPVPDQRAPIPGLMIIVYAETPVISIHAKVPVLGQVHECTQADFRYLVQSSILLIPHT